MCHSKHNSKSVYWSGLQFSMLACHIDGRHQALTYSHAAKSNINVHSSLLHEEDMYTAIRLCHPRAIPGMWLLVVLQLAMSIDAKGQLTAICL